MSGFPFEPYVPTLGEYAEVIGHFADGGTRDIRQELHEESQGAQERSRRRGEWETPR